MPLLPLTITSTNIHPIQLIHIMSPPVPKTELLWTCVVNFSRSCSLVVYDGSKHNWDDQRLSVMKALLIGLSRIFPNNDL